MAASFRTDASPALLDGRAGEQNSVSDEQQRDLFALRSDPSRVGLRLLKPNLAWSLLYRVAVHDMSAQPAQAGSTTAERGGSWAKTTAPTAGQFPIHSRADAAVPAKFQRQACPY